MHKFLTLTDSQRKNVYESISPDALSLPAKEISDTLNRHLKDNACVVVTAPPGAGKSTLLPLTILQGLEDIEGKVIMLEPRRLAARGVAERMADLINEPVGKTVGYRMRFESKVSEDTRIEVLTEGLLSRMLIDDPTLEGVSVVIFDEFHERSLTSDSCLALTRQAQQIIRPDLRIVIMSATIDADNICKALEAPLIESKGRMFPVEIINEETGRIKNDDRSGYYDCAKNVAQAIISAHDRHEGDILAFLPGQADIMRCMDLLGNSLGNTNIYPLYGLLSNKEQRLAVAPSAEGERKVVLATSIAETSVTIEGVRVVIDSGLCRKMVFNQQTGLSHLETVQISMDMATQRSGRAGRVAPGVCYRLWSKATEHRMEECRIPEILEADLMPMLLDFAAWGESDLSSFTWLTPPPPTHVSIGREALQMLNATDMDGRITSHGIALSKLPCHPRIAQMLITANTDMDKSLATDIAAIIEEKDPLAQNTPDSDINTRIYELRKARAQGKLPKQWERIEQVAGQYRRMVKVKADNSTPDTYMTGSLLASAYPERIASADKAGMGGFILASGDRACVDRNDSIAAYDWIVIANVNTQSGSGKIFLASPLNPKDISHLMRTRDNVSWDNKQGTLIAQRESFIGRLIIGATPIQTIRREDVVRILGNAISRYGTSIFNINDKVQNLQQRIATVAEWHPELEIPDVSTESIMNRGEEWADMFLLSDSSLQTDTGLIKCARLNSTELGKTDMEAVIWSMLTYEQQTATDRLAPHHLTVPSGSKIKVEYRKGAELPILRVRLQECFGLTDTPRVNDGQTPVLMELLSPGFKPVQLTQDLSSFWQNAYFEVRSELRRRYPKHSWPDNPLESEAVKGVKRRNT